MVPSSDKERTPERQPRQVVAALILHGEKILICQRKADQPMSLKWEFPGGKIEPGESPPEALVRELHEELGINAQVGGFVTSIHHNYRNGGGVILHFYRVDNYSGELKNHIFKDVRWEELRKLPSYDFLRADYRLVRDLAAGKLL
jgi:8-oxo-dGTP diphosphatase